MNVAIIGGGAIGLLLGFYFAKNQEQTTLYVRRREQADLLERSGLKLAREGTLREVKVHAKVLEETESIEADLVVIAVKQYDLRGLTDLLRTKVSETTKLLFVQNGMSHLPFMKALRQSNIYVGIVEHGALKNGEHKVEHTGSGTVKLAAFRGDLADAAPIWDKLNDTKFPLEYREDWYSLMAEKLLVNAVINPLTALFRVENGALVERPGFQRNMRRLFEEAFSVLDLGSKSECWENVQNVCRSTAKNRSSMLRDIELGRPTEIAAISGYLLECGKAKNLVMPYTEFVYDGMKSMSGSEVE